MTLKTLLVLFAYERKQKKEIALKCICLSEMTGLVVTLVYFLRKLIFDCTLTFFDPQVRN